MDRNELRALIQQKEAEFERAKLKRFAYTVLFYTIIYMVFCYWRGDFGSATFLSLDWFLTFGGSLLGSALLSVISVLFNAVIFHQLYERSTSENRHIEYLKKQLDNMDK